MPARRAGFPVSFFLINERPAVGERGIREAIVPWTGEAIGTEGEDERRRQACGSILENSYPIGRILTRCFSMLKRGVNDMLEGRSSPNEYPATGCF